MRKKNKTKGEEIKDGEKERKRSILCHSMFEHMKKPEGFELAMKTIKECLTDPEKADDIHFQIKAILNGEDRQKRDDLSRLLNRALDKTAYAELGKNICCKCEVKISHENCKCEIWVHEGLTMRELFEAVVKKHNLPDLSFDEILEKAFNASVNLHKENGILDGLIHIFKHGIPSLNETEFQQV